MPCIQYKSTMLYSVFVIVVNGISWKETLCSSKDIFVTHVMVYFFSRGWYTLRKKIIMCL